MKKQSERERQRDGWEDDSCGSSANRIESHWKQLGNEEKWEKCDSSMQYKKKKQVNCWTGADGSLLNSIFKLCDKTQGSLISLSSALNVRSAAARLKTVGSLPPPRPPQRPVFKTARTYIGPFEMSPIRSVLMFRGSIGSEQRTRRHARKINSVGSCVGSRRQL